MHNIAYIGLGSNLGRCKENLHQAAEALAVLSSSPVLASSLWTSEAEGFDIPADPFVNAVLRVTVRIEPEALLDQLMSVEASMGRDSPEKRHRPGQGYQSRIIDLDLLDYGGLILNTPVLQLPHPRAHLRRFVLLPLQEIAPDFRFPGLAQSLDALIAAAPANPMLRAGNLLA